MDSKKINKMLRFFNQSVKGMVKDPNFKTFSEEEIFNLALDVCMNEFIARGENPPIGEVDRQNVAFCISENEDLDLIFLNGENFLDDED